MEPARGDEQPILTMTGDIDIASEQEWRRRGGELLDAHPDMADIVIDMAGVSFLDSRGMAVLIHLHGKALGPGREAHAARRPAACGEGAQRRRARPALPGRTGLNRLNQPEPIRIGTVPTTESSDPQDWSRNAQAGYYFCAHSASSASAAGGGRSLS